MDDVLESDVLENDVLENDARYVWRPFTSSEQHEGEQLEFVSARGMRIKDLRGRSWLDASGSWWTNHLGYGHPRLKAALCAQAEAMPHIALGEGTHAPASLLARDLIAHAPSGLGPKLARVFYSDNGSTAVEVALKLCVQRWYNLGQPERRVFLSLPGAYHGDTIGAMSVGALEAFGAPFVPLLFESVRQPELRDQAALEAATLATLERAFEPQIAGVIVEPLVLGAAGMRMYSPEILRKIREVTIAAQIPLIADEVFTGIGRTGKFWACDHAEISPDLLCSSKGLTGGTLPFAATLVSEEIAEAFRGDTSRAFLHGHTYCGNPLGARVAREVLAIVDEEEVLARSAARQARLVEAAARWSAIPGTLRARSLGMIAAVDLGDGGYHAKRGAEVARQARARGVLLRPLGDVVYVTPPLIGEDAELEALLSAIDDSLVATLARA